MGVSIKRMLGLGLGLALGAPLHAISWTAVTGPQGGAVVALDYSPAYPTDQTLYAVGQWSSNLYRSTDQGAHWTFLSRAGGSVDHLCFSPNFSSDATLFAWSQLDYTSCGVPENLAMSRDGGSTWAQILFPGAVCYSLAPDPGFGANQTLYAAVQTTSTGDGAVVRSTDGGATWANLVACPGGLQGFAMSPTFATDHTLVLDVYSLGGPWPGQLFKSVDSGATWTTYNLPSVGPLSLSPNFAADNTMLLSPGGGILYRSTDGGATWADIGGGLPAAFSSDYSAEPAVFSPNYAVDQTCFLPGGMGGGLAQWNGSVWTAQDTGLTDQDVLALAVSPGYAADHALAAGTDAAGIELSTASSPNFGLSNLGFQEIGRYLAVAPAYPTLHSLFAFDSLGLFRSVDAGATWQPLSGTSCIGLGFSPAYASDHTLGACFSTGIPGVYLSVDAGLSWSLALSSTTDTFGTPQFSPSYASDNTLFVNQNVYATNGISLLRSGNRGGTWQSVTQWPQCYYNGTAFSPGFAADGTVWASFYQYNSGLQTSFVLKSTDHGSTWTDTSTTAGSSFLAVSPNFPADGTLFSSLGDGVSSLKAYKSTNGGATWSPLSAAPETYFGVIAFSPGFATDQTLFGAGIPDYGSCGPGIYDLYESTDGGNCWFPLPTTGLGQDSSAIYYPDSTYFSSGFAADRTGWCLTELYRSEFYVSTNYPTSGPCNPTATPTPTPTRAASASPTPAASATRTPNPAPSPTNSPGISPTPTWTVSPTPSLSPSFTASPGWTASATLSPSFTVSPTWTLSPSPSATPTASPTWTVSPTASPSPVVTATPTAAPAQGPPVILWLGTAPSPLVNGQGKLMFNLQGRAQRLSVDFYSAALAKVGGLQWQGNFGPGWVSLPLSGFATYGLPGGLLYLKASASNDAGSGSRVAKTYVLW